jgi:prevent-host-death family protein
MCLWGTAVTVNIHEAKTHFSRLIDRVLQGEEVTIAKAGRPVARLVPAATRSARRVPGSARGKVVISPNFDAPLPDEFLAKFHR